MGSDAVTPRVDRRAQRAEAKRHARRAQILEAALRRFSGHGYHATSIADVIDDAKISRGTFYLYFDGKAALFHELLDRFVEQLKAAVHVVDPAAPEPELAMYANIRRVVDVMFDSRDLAVLMMREAVGMDGEVDRKLDQLYGFLQDMVQGALSKGARCGMIRAVDEVVVATALVGSAKEVFYRYLVSHPAEVCDRDRIARALFDLGARGLLPGGRQ